MSNTTIPNVSHVIFDVGGVLRDSKVTMMQSINHALESQSIDLVVDEEFNDTLWNLRGTNSFNSLTATFRAMITTHSLNKDLSSFLENLDGENQLLDLITANPPDESLITALKEAYRTKFAEPEMKQTIKLIDGINEALESLKNSGLVLGVISNSTMRSLNRDLIDQQKYFDLFIGEAKKPGTTVYLNTLKENNIEPKNVLYVGDAASDVEMAHAAGSFSCAVLSGMGTTAQLAATNPTILCQDITELANLFEKQ